MAMKDEALLKLYLEDQEDRKILLQLKRTNKDSFEKIQQKVLRNDAKRRELLDDLMPESNHKPARHYRDYFYAAVILNRSNALLDQKKAYDYATKAYQIAKFQQDSFSEQVKAFYKKMSNRLEIEQSSVKRSTVIPQRSNLLIPKLTPPGMSQKHKKKNEEELLQKKPSMCPFCRALHTGPCRPR